MSEQKTKINSHVTGWQTNHLLLFTTLIFFTIFPFSSSDNERTASGLFAFTSVDSDTVINYFPMNVGDYHIYEVRYDFRDPPMFNTTNVLDTILIDSIFYYQVRTYWRSSLSLRMDEIGDLYAYSTEDSQDVLLYKFHSALGDSYRVDSLASGFSSKLYSAKIGTTYYGDIVSVEDDIVTFPNKYFLMQNHPNPFNPVTTISYSLPFSGDVSLIIYNILGEEIAQLVDGFQQAGEYNITWNATNISSGIYFYRLNSGDFTETKKMVLLK